MISLLLVHSRDFIDVDTCSSILFGSSSCTKVINTILTTGSRQETYIIDLSLAFNHESAVRSDISFHVFGDPTVDHAVVATGGEEHTLIIRDSNTIDWILMLIKCSD